MSIKKKLYSRNFFIANLVILGIVDWVCPGVCVSREPTFEWCIAARRTSRDTIHDRRLGYRG